MYYQINRQKLIFILLQNHNVRDKNYVWCDENRVISIQPNKHTKKHSLIKKFMLTSNFCLDKKNLFKNIKKYVKML